VGTIINHALVIISPFLILYGFIFETINNPGIERDVGSLGVLLLFVWLINVGIGKVVGAHKFSK
jgi:hypothetical protein